MKGANLSVFTAVQGHFQTNQYNTSDDKDLLHNNACQMAKDGNLAKAKGGKPKAGKAKVDKKNDEEGEEMEGGVEGEEMKFDGLHQPRGGPTMVSVHWASCTH